MGTLDTVTDTGIESVEAREFFRMLDAGERLTFHAARDRAWDRYRGKHGSRVARLAGEEPTRYGQLVREHAAAWNVEHLEAVRADVYKAVRAAVKRRHAKVIKAPAEYVAKCTVTAPDAAYLARLEAAAESSRTRMVELGLVPVKGAKSAGSTRRKGQSVKPAPVEPVAPVAESVPTVPDAVPAPMPRMRRAARKASNRELAARMRAAGVPITAESWAAAKAGTLPDLAA